MSTQTNTQKKKNYEYPRLTTSWLTVQNNLLYGLERAVPQRNFLMNITWSNCMGYTKEKQQNNNLIKSVTQRAKDN